MTFLLVLLVLLSGLLLTPLGARVCYVGDTLSLYLRIGHFYKKLLPKKKKKADEKPKKPKKAKKKKEKKPKEETAGEKKKKVKKPISFYLRLAKMALSSSKIFFRSIVIDRINARVIFAGGDPAKTAITYGRVSAALENAQPILQRFKALKRYDVQLNVDFCRDKLLAEGEIEISFMLWSIFGMGSCFGWAFIKMMLSDKWNAFAENRRLKKEQHKLSISHGGNYERV